MSNKPDLNELAIELASKYKDLRNEIAKVIVGQDEAVDLVLTSIFCNGHSLLVGVPGLAKTLLVSTIAQVLELSFNRIQFTPDLMPSDIVGAEILDETRNFKFNKGPIFSNIILADEINRTPPKTQAALLEAMQEKSVTINGVRNTLPKPFFVLATQNPIEQEGTYPLPEAQLDRFMFNIILDYPTYAEEVQVVKNTTSNLKFDVSKILNGADILKFQDLIRQVTMPDGVIEKTVTLVGKTRPGRESTPEIINDYIAYGAGPRAAQNLVLAAKCHAILRGKKTPDYEDVKAVALPILRHRLFKNYKAEAEGYSTDKIIQEIL